MKFDLHPKSGLTKPTIEVQIFLWVNITQFEFKLQALQPILNEKMSIREADSFLQYSFQRSSRDMVETV